MMIVLLGGLAAATALVAALVWRPDYRDVLLFFITATVPLRAVSLLDLPGAHLRIGDAFLIAAAAAALTEVLVRGGMRIGALEVTLFAFVVWCSVTLIWTLDPPFGVARTAKFARNLALFAVIAHWARGRFDRTFRIIVAGVVTSFAYIGAMIAVLLTRSGFDFGALRQIEAASSSELKGLRTGVLGGGAFGGSINALAVWTVFAIFLWLGTGLWAAPRLRHRVVFWMVLTPMLFIEILTFSRGSWVALGVAGAWWLVRVAQRMPRRALAVVFLGTVLGGAVLVRFELHRLLFMRLQSISVPSQDEAVSVRFGYWTTALQVLREQPTGVGIGGTTEAIEPVTGEWFVHNIYLQVLVEVGPLGLALMLLAGTWATVAALRTSRRAAQWRDRVAALSITGAILSYFIGGIFGRDFTELEIWMLFALVTALPCAVAVRKTRMSDTPAVLVPRLTTNH